MTCSGDRDRDRTPPAQRGQDAPRKPVTAVPNGSPAWQHNRTVTVYWRPGCRYCAKLRRDLRRIGLATTQVNICEVPEAAAAVRAVTGGNETVPTVVVGETVLVNPSAASVLDAARALAPGLVTGDVVRRARRQQILSVVQWVTAGAVLEVSLAAAAMGYASAAWALGGAAFLIYLGFRIARW